MAEYRIDILNTLALAFGARANYYHAEAQLQDAAPSTTYSIQIDNSDAKGEGLGLVGLPIFQRIVITDPQDENGSLDLFDCLVDFSMTQNIVKTPVNGRDGTIKEFVSDGDYEISIKGLLIDQDHPNRIPEEAIRKALQWFRKGKALGVEAKIFDVFGVHNIVVESFHMPQIPTYIQMRPFELKCISDTEYTIDLDNNV